MMTAGKTVKCFLRLSSCNGAQIYSNHKDHIMSFRPLHDRVVVRRNDAVERTAGGIVLPGASKEKPSQGTVVAVGDGTIDAKGNHKPLSIAVGSTVVFGKSAGHGITVDGEELQVMRENEIYGVIETNG